MGGRDVPFDKELKCDDCGADGAFDFMGDYLCPTCVEKCIPSDDGDDELNIFSIVLPSPL